MIGHGPVWIALVTAACTFNAGFPGPLARCESDGACPDHYLCVDQRCVPTEPEAAACASAMTAGDAHTCAIRSDGTAWCWGANDFGQLGDGTTLDRTSPVQVSGKALPRLTAITGGKTHSCALGDDHTVWCWGQNDVGQLGDGSVADNPDPVQVLDLTDAQEIVAGDSHTCALLLDGHVTCWGNNASGQLGNGKTISGNMPVAAQIAGVTAVAAGGDTTCAVDGKQALWCWGANSDGQFGTGTATPGPTPTQVSTGGAAGVAVGRGFSCVLTTDGAVQCAGQNAQGQLGNPIGTASRTRVMVALRRPAVAIAAGDTFACATDGDKRLWCWGENDSFQFADGTSDNHAVPTLTTYADVQAMVGGGAHLCARSTIGGIRCSGYDGRGQLGDGRRTTQPTPQPIAGLSGVTAIAGGGANTCVTLADKTVMCWGDNRSGQVGDGTRIGRTRPTPVESVKGASGLATGGSYACALLEGGTPMCWGANDHGQLGDGSSETRSSASEVIEATTGKPLTGVTQLVTAGTHSCALGDNGVVSCWGQGYLALSPEGESKNFLSATVMAAAPQSRALAAAVLHACAIDLAGVTRCWGHNSGGELGDGGSASGNPPDPVVGLGAAVDQIAAQNNFACAHATDRTVWCWGRNDFGQLGYDTTTVTIVAKQAVGLSDTTKVTTGGTHACARNANGTIACWGANDSGQLGTGYYTDQHVPTAIRIDHVRDLAAGARHTCALLDNGTVSCWGDDSLGQLGDGAAATHASVAPVLPCR